MDRERIFRHLEQRYSSKRDMIARIPLGAQADALWQELLNRRRSSSTVLPINDRLGRPYWYVTTEKMVAASEKIVETLLENEKEFDPYTEAPTVSTLEEVFYTSYVDGAQMSIQEAMSFLQSESPPRDVEELLIVNNRKAGGFASSNLYRPINADYIRELASILTEGIDGGGDGYRTTDGVDYPAPDGESFTFPMAQSIPNRVDEFTLFLADQKVHPLIKAAVAQAWTMVVRPFTEGNERLGRILSSVILVRSGYTFFGEISLSALIARKGYGYFEAMANIMREENGEDLTYFLEYFMELLSRAIDERHLRMTAREEQTIAAEMEMAKAPLSPRGVIPPSTPATCPVDPESTYDPPDEDAKSPVDEIKEAVDEGTPYEKILRYAEKPQRVIGGISVILLRKINEGVLYVATAELAKELNLDSRQLSSSIRYLKINGILQEGHRINGKRAYKIISAGATADQLNTVNSEVMERLRELAESNSAKDKRIAAIIQDCMGKGEVTLDDYEARGKGARWATDMQFAAQLGLVEKITPRRYSIQHELKKESPALSKTQKRFITDLYDSFGGDTFSIEMIVATLDYSSPHASAALHQFTLMRLVDCRTDDSNQFQYQFLITPQDHPECFELAA